MNSNKVGSPFKITNSYILFITIIRYIFSMTYRQLEGFTISLNRLIPKLPSIDYSWVRKRILKLDLSPYYKLRDSKEPVAIAIDASGIRVHKCIDGLKGCMVGRERGISRYTLLSIDIKTKEIISIDITTMTHESKVINKLIRGASKHRVITKAYMDGAYDSYRSYKIKSIGIRAFIKPRRNARVDRGHTERRITVRLIKEYGEELGVSYAMVRGGLLRQPSQRSKDYMENTAWPRA